MPRLFDEFDRFAAATAGREVKGEMPPGYEATFRYSLLDPDADVAAEAAAFRPAFAHLALLVQIPGVDIAGPGRGGEGEPADRTRDARSSTSGSRPRGPGWRPTPPSAPAWPSATTRCPDEAAALEPDQRAFLGGARRDGRGGHRSTGGEAWQDAIFTAATAPDCPPAVRSRALYLAFLGRTNGPRAGWLLASLDPAFVLGRLREAAAQPRRTAAGGAA